MQFDFNKSTGVCGRKKKSNCVGAISGFDLFKNFKNHFLTSSYSTKKEF